MAGQTLQEKYYAINAAVANFLEAKGFNVPVYKYGIDPALLKDDLKTQPKKYPYFQSHLLPSDPQSWTSQESGIYTRFEYQLSFFTSPRFEYTNGTELWRVFETAKLAFSDIQSDVLRRDPNDPTSSTIADVLSMKVEQNFGVVSGAIVPSGIIIVKMATIVGYPVSIPPVGDATNIDAAVVINS